LEGCERIRSGLILSSSIDDFVDAHRKDTYIAACGKLAIVSSILEAERKSKLFFERKNVRDSIKFSAIEDTWYVGFYRLLAQQVEKDELGSLFKNVSIVTFNYDRCIEHFLTHALALNYGLSWEMASKLVEGLPIYRPYGSVGSYFGSGAVGFGASPNLQVEVVSKNVRTYTERIEDQSGLNKIRAAIDNAKVLVFLGFAFHSNNLRVLGEENLYSPSKRVFATRMGISDSDLQVVESRLRRLCGLGGGDFHYLAETRRCADLFDQYQISLRP
jgi:hypothetical protein